MGLLTDAQRNHAEAVIRRNVDGNNWDPAGYSLIVDRLDRLVKLAEQLVTDHQDG
ncbi:hypothetical protein [Streptomyces sp. NPDC005231]|uniref:hypothetical protein n=1 Tax=Streptomyces sp. NPDC005231 TaxID=3157026 RepID=UPI0033AF2654